MCIYKEIEIYFKELAYMIVEADKSKSAGRIGVWRPSADRIPFSSREDTLFSSQAFKLLGEAHPQFGA